MRILVLAGLAASCLTALPAAAQAPTRSVTVTPVTTTTAPVVVRTAPSVTRWNWGQSINGRWWGGYQAPGGWAGYRRPVAGFVLPGYWLQPSYHIADYAYFGLPAPQPGYGWSRYYDDAVLTDRYGKVYESRVGYDWDRYPAYEADGRQSSARYEIAGPRYDVGQDDPDRLKNEQKLAREERKQRAKLDKLARRAGYANYDAYRNIREGSVQTASYAPLPVTGDAHWAVTGGPEGDQAVSGVPRIETEVLPGHVANGYYYPGDLGTTVTIDHTE